ASRTATQPVDVCSHLPRRLACPLCHAAACRGACALATPRVSIVSSGSLRGETGCLAWSAVRSLPRIRAARRPSSAASPAPSIRCVAPTVSRPLCCPVSPDEGGLVRTHFRSGELTRARLGGTPGTHLNSQLNRSSRTPFSPALLHATSRTDVPCRCSGG